MPKVFVSYRREDSAAITGHLCDRLKGRFGAEQVFVDVDNIPYGIDFVDHIRDMLSRCDVFLAIIGRKWRGKVVGGRSRLDYPDDFVRLELETALAQSMAVLPVLVDGAKMPEADKLPAGLRSVCRINAAPLDAGKDFHYLADQICSAVEDITARVAALRTEGESAQTPLAVSARAANDWFSAFTGGGTVDVEYQCKKCGYHGFIDKREWFRDGERPPTRCPKCGNAE